ncbi:hypothetical protein D1AOALGA4SA_8468 [Olavius algarvensis Delta 1 endosymbiont]|nr:hypothetical protein D1AOALGA4SA_8468 [Olavius algarvensis Delta 1 endosymbiont]
MRSCDNHFPESRTILSRPVRIFFIRPIIPSRPKNSKENIALTQKTWSSGSFFYPAARGAEKIGEAVKLCRGMMKNGNVGIVGSVGMSSE